MRVISIVDDYLFAAMVRAKGTRVENGTLVLTVPEFSGIVACGENARQAFVDLYRLLEDWVRVSLEKGYRLPVMETENGAIDLNTSDGRVLAAYHLGNSIKRSEHDQIYIGSPEEFEAFIDDSGPDK